MTTNGELAFSGGDVVMAQPEGFPDAHARLMQHGEQEPVPQVFASIQDRLRLTRAEHAGQLLRAFSAMALRLVGSPLLMW